MQEEPANRGMYFREEISFQSDESGRFGNGVSCPRNPRLG
jgi:hypothetical protein